MEKRMSLVPRTQTLVARGCAWRGSIALLVLVAVNACGTPPAPVPSTAPAPTGGSAPLPVEPVQSGGAPAVKETTPAAIVESDFGVYNGSPVKLFTLTNEHGLVLKAMTYGAIITEFHVPDRNGKHADIVLGFDDLKGYVGGNAAYFGATVGRVANRIKNAKFTLEGKPYLLAANDGPHSLHGGNRGWDKVVWNAKATETPDGPQVTFSYVSPHEEEGYPGNVQASSTYTLTHDDRLRVEMRATSDKTTLVNMVHHSYWNLAGHAAGTIEDHELVLFADEYTPANGLVPDGSVKRVKGTPFDFRAQKPIGKDLKAAGGKPVGFDHNWVVNGDPNALRTVATLKHPGSGRTMTLSADQPGVQFYTGNFLDGTARGKGGTAYPQYAGLCLETQKFPNSINVPAWQAQVILKPGATYQHTMVHAFSVE